MTAPPVQRGPRRPIPRRYYPHGRGRGLGALMDCRECRTPWAPNVPIPYDRLCVRCRPAATQLALFDIQE